MGDGSGPAAPWCPLPVAGASLRTRGLPAQLQDLSRCFPLRAAAWPLLPVLPSPFAWHPSGLAIEWAVVLLPLTGGTLGPQSRRVAAWPTLVVPLHSPEGRHGCRLTRPSLPWALASGSTTGGACALLWLTLTLGAATRSVCCVPPPQLCCAAGVRVMGSGGLRWARAPDLGLGQCPDPGSACVRCWQGRRSAGLCSAIALGISPSGTRWPVVASRAAVRVHLLEEALPTSLGAKLFCLGSQWVAVS